MHLIRGSVHKQSHRWLSLPDERGRRVSLAIDHISHIYIADVGRYMGLVFVMVNDREVTLYLEDVTTQAKAMEILEQILKEIA